MPAVSVIVPAHDRRPLVLDAVASALGQTFADLEVVVVDDGSTDGTREAVAALGDPRVRLISLQRCGRVGMVRNAGVEAAEGEWLALLDSDDLWYPDRLRVQLASLVESSAGWGFCGYHLVDEDGRTVLATFEPVPVRDATGLLLRLIDGAEGAPPTAVMVRRSLFDRIGGFSTDPLIREDLDLVLRLAETGAADVVPRILAVGPPRATPTRSSARRFPSSGCWAGPGLARSPGRHVACARTTSPRRHGWPCGAAT